MSEPSTGSQLTKSQRTRSAIVEAALQLFRERGYQQTTMRDIAARAGVSVGNAYYYFGSKEELIQGFYDSIASEHAEASAVVLSSTNDFGERLRQTLLAWLEVAEPYHEFAGKLFAVAAHPENPLSPFSPESSAARQAAIGVYGAVLTGSNARPEARLAKHLPELLWLYHLGIVLFWVHDRSPGLTRTRELIERSTPLVERLVALSRLRLLRRTTTQAVAVLETLRGSPGSPA